MNKELSSKELAYVNNYCIHYSKAEAARAAGYKGPNVVQQGWNIFDREHVQAAIKERLRLATLSADETLKMISDTSRGNMSSYMKPVKKWHTPQVKKGLQEIIDENIQHIEMEDEFCTEAGLVEEEFDKFQAQLNIVRRRNMRLRIELKRNPEAFRIVDGVTEEIEVMELDLAAIVADKERGIIKSYKVTKEGVQIEICDPDASKDRLAKVHGLYEKDNRQVAGDQSKVIQVEIVQPKEVDE